jgi:hypothetical protein
MPISIVFDHDNRFMQATASGPIDLKEFERYLDEIVVQNAISYRRLYDCREARYIYNDEEIMQVGARISAYAAFEPRGPVAIVAITDENVALSRRFLNLGGATRPGKLFHTIAAARKWLDLQPLPELPPRK